MLLLRSIKNIYKCKTKNDIIIINNMIMIINMFPPEILAEIGKYLSEKDRRISKSDRYVC